jgi:hypothetical protein
MREGPKDESGHVLTEYAHTSRSVLGENFVGLYPLGSLAIGDFDQTSDVDFAIVVKAELSPDEVRLVQAAHTELVGRDSRWVKHLEYSFFPLAKLLQKPPPASPNGSAARELWYFQNGATTSGDSGRTEARNQGIDASMGNAVHSRVPVQ